MSLARGKAERGASDQSATRSLASAADRAIELLAVRVVSLLAPPRCVVCRSPVAAGAILCGGCRSALVALPRGRRAPVRGAALASHFAAFPMTSPARELVHALKYRSAVAAAPAMAAMMISRAPPGLLAPGSALVPVPAHPMRARARGYNQSALLAHALSRRQQLPVLDCLDRRRDGLPQTGMPRAMRLQMPTSDIRATGARFRLRGEMRQFPTNVVLVDDVVTTGVTLEVCASAIRKRFGSEVRAVTFASTSANPGRYVERRQPRG